MLFFTASYLAEKVGQKVVGQEKAVKEIAKALCENFEDYAENRPFKRNNVLLTGPTGSGKTQIARSLSQVLKVPFVKVVMSDFTLTGYRGRDPQAMVVEDLKRAIRKEHREALKEMRISYLAGKKVLDALKGSSVSPVVYRAAAEFCGATVFFEEEEVEEKLLDRFGGERWVKELLVELKGALEESRELLRAVERHKISQPFDEKPFGVVFVDEFDKIFINERDGDSESFYRPLQEFMLPMVEGAVITTEEGRIDTAFITFIMSGSFAQRSVDEIVPELRGRLNVRAEVRKLSYRDYLKIVEIEGIEIPEVLKGKLVEVKRDALVEIAKVCEELNSVKYLGARRLKEVVSRVNDAIMVELENPASLPVEVNGNFVRWAVSCWSGEEVEPSTSVSFSFAGEEVRKVVRSVLKKEKLQSSLVEELLESSRRWLKENDGIIDATASSLSYLLETLLVKDLDGKSILEYLVEEGSVSFIHEKCLEVAEKRLGKEAVERIKEKVPVMPDFDF